LISGLAAAQASCQLRKQSRRLTPPYVKLLDVAKLLVPDSRLRLYDGDIAGAFHNVHAALPLEPGTRRRALLFAQLVRRAIDMVALDILEQTLAGGTVSEFELAKVQSELEFEGATSFLCVAYGGERASTDRLLEEGCVGCLY